MDTYKNVCVDLTPGGEMFVGFTDNYDEACSFFKKYQDRILYGTDMYNTFENVENDEYEINRGFVKAKVHSVLKMGSFSSFLTSSAGLFLILIIFIMFMLSSKR